jgi:hypothetical protein
MVTTVGATFSTTGAKLLIGPCNVCAGSCAAAEQPQTSSAINPAIAERDGKILSRIKTFLILVNNESGAYTPLVPFYAEVASAFATIFFAVHLVFEQRDRTQLVPR